MTVFENVGFGLKIRKWKKAEDLRPRARAAAAWSSSTGSPTATPPSSPAASASAWPWPGRWRSQPQVLLLDEPFGALDAKVRKDLRTWLRNLHEEMHVTTIFVTHDQEEAMDVAGQLVVMNEGRVEQSGSADDLYEQPANEFVMSFVGEVNRLGEHFVRPHDMEVVLDADERTEEAMVQRIVALGFEIRVEFVLADGTEVWAQLTRAELQKLELREGQIVYLRPGQAKSFNGVVRRPTATGPRLPAAHRTAATQRYLQPSEEATGRGALCRVAPRPISPAHVSRRSKVFSSACSSSSPATVLSSRTVASRPSRRRVADLVVEVGALEQAPADARVRGAGRAAPGRAPAALNGRREAGPDHAPLVARRAGCGRASRPPGRRRSRISASGLKAISAEVGVVDVAGEDDDRGRRLAALARADLSSSSRRRWKENWKEAQWSKSTARRSFSLPRATSPPQAPSQSRSFQASR